MCGSAPKAPPPPEPTAQEIALMEKQGQMMDAYISSIEEQKLQNKDLGLLTAVSSGLYDPVYKDGKLIDATLNQQRVSDLRSDIDTNRRIGLLQADRYEKALKGELPVSEGLKQRKADDFRLLREIAARRGNEITGDAAEAAALTPQNSTAGNELVGQFARTYGLLEDAERRGELAGGYGGTLGSQTLSLGLGQQAFGPGASLTGYSQGSGLLSQGLQPYQYQRGLQYQSSYQNAVNAAQQRSDTAGLLGMVGGQVGSSYIRSAFSPAGGVAATTGTGATAASGTGNGLMGAYTAPAAFVALGMAWRNAIEKGTVGGTFGEINKIMDPYSGHSTKNIPKEFIKSPGKMLNPVNHARSIAKSIKKLF